MHQTNATQNNTFRPPVKALHRRTLSDLKAILDEAVEKAPERSTYFPNHPAPSKALVNMPRHAPVEEEPVTTKPGSIPPPSQICERVAQHVIIERNLAAYYRMINRESYLLPWENSSQDEIKEAETEFNSKCVELNSFELEMLEQYNEVCSTFNTLCISKLVQRKPSVFSLMSRIYGVFEKYGIESGKRDEFILEFIDSNPSDSQRFVRIGEGKFNGLFCYSKYTLRFNLSISTEEKYL